MAKTINFCGDSFCAEVQPTAWTYILADLLDYTILGRGKAGSAHEHAIQSFDETADFTVFCWTEPDRLYHPTLPINFAQANAQAKSDRIYRAAKIYYDYLHDFDHSIVRQMRELYWFDQEVLSLYSGKIFHCWSFMETYQFTHGTTFNTPLFDLRSVDASSTNHMTVEQNYTLAHEIYNLIRRTYG